MYSVKIKSGRMALALWKKRYKIAGILTKNNPKIDKSTDYGYLTVGLHLSPYTKALSVIRALAEQGDAQCIKVNDSIKNGVKMPNTCPYSTSSCRAVCLDVSGAAFIQPKKDKSRAIKTFLLAKSPGLFYAAIAHEINLAQGRAKKRGLRLAVRLNLTSDIQPPLWLIKAFPAVKFYDYTKDYSRTPRTKNEHLTYSVHDKTRACDVNDLLLSGQSLAVVFPHDKPLPRKFMGRIVTDATKHDLRFLDGPKIAGLKALAGAKKNGGRFIFNH